MIGKRALPALWACLLLLATLCPCALSRRGGMGRGFGGRMGGMNRMGMGARAPPMHSGSSSNTGMKVAGAAAAGALGGAMIGHGLSSMSRPGYGYGYGGYGAGYGYGPGYGRHPGYGTGYGGGSRYDEFRNETDREYYYDSSSCQAASGFVILGSMLSFLIGHWFGI